MVNLTKAILTATNLHAGAVDKTGSPYILHPLRVMLALEQLGEDHMVPAVLHDLVEDTDYTLELAISDFGEEVASAVDAVTRRESEPYGDFICRAKKHPVGRLIKIADIEDNLRPERVSKLPECERFRMQRRYLHALLVLRSEVAASK